MSRPKLHTNAAAKQRAYRKRKAREKRNAEALRNTTKSPVKVSRPALRYLGGKWRLADWILESFPPHNVYVEPFMGAASVFLQKNPANIECVNDLDGNVINFFDMLRARPDDLIRAIRLTPYSRGEWERSFNLEPEVDPLEQARRFYIRSRQSFNPSHAVNPTSPSWRRQPKESRGKSVAAEWAEVDHLYAVAERFKQAQIERRPALDVIREFDGPDTLIFADPPYMPETRTGHLAIYAHEMDEEEHRELLETLRACHAMVVLSGYPNALYDDLLDGWTTRTTTARVNHSHSTKVEKLWINQSANERLYPLFNMGLGA